MNTDEKSTVLCLENKEKPGSVQIMELRRGDLTGKKLDKKLFDSWDEYQDFLIHYEPECDDSDNCKCEDCKFWARRYVEEDNDDYDSGDEYW